MPGFIKLTPYRNKLYATLKASPFNKVRMCVFPKWYDHNRKEPALYPFEGTAPTSGISRVLIQRFSGILRRAFKHWVV